VLLRPGFPSQTVTPGQAGQLWVSLTNGTGWQARPVPCLTPHGGGAAVLSIARGHPDAWLLDCFNNEQSSQEQNTQHHLYGTADGGLSWVRLPDPTRHNMPVMLADNGSGHAFLATEGGFDTLVGTLDYGRHWHPVLRDGGSFFGWAGLSFVTAETGFVVGPPPPRARAPLPHRRWRPHVAGPALLTPLRAAAQAGGTALFWSNRSSPSDDPIPCLPGKTSMRHDDVGL
jgi:hypothetical protein